MLPPVLPRALRCSRLAASSYFTRPALSAPAFIRRSLPFSRHQSTDAPPNRLSGAHEPQEDVPHAWNSPRPHADLAHDVSAHLNAMVDKWRLSGYVRERLGRFGIPPRDLDALIDAFARALTDGSAWAPASESHAALSRMWSDLSEGETEARIQALDRALTQLFYRWAADPAHAAVVRPLAAETTLERMGQIARCVDLRTFADLFPMARMMRRKVIMHVGPTNSGKTHNALRALAAARVGVYMGPLRLLAYEIFERLNAGQIIPLGADPDKDPHAVPDAKDADAAESNFDVAPDKPVFRRTGDPRYVRPCSLITGEERREVPGASTYACTIEMLDHSRVYDVAVVDEIQMVDNTERGAAWTLAVLATPARELHLCGEETAVPLVREMLRHTGDELVVNRYARLSPLTVADESFDGDLRNVQKGDCVVAFARSAIFKYKERIELATGLKCAVAYGRLPPEVRSEQAALFNDPNSGYDVMVATDAIGMGLNLCVTSSSPLHPS
jgi:ATP-dependent RNA helicase SUPV3L1/SUV3